MERNMEIEKIKDTLIKELKLHDATISQMILQDNVFKFNINCKGMEISKIYKDVDNIYFTVKCFDVIKLNFDFDSIILIDKLNIKEENNIIIIETSNDDLYVECKRYDIVINVVYRKKENNNVLEILNKI